MPRAGSNSQLWRWLTGWALAACSLLAPAQDRTQLLELDSQRSHADFEVKLLWLVGVHGRFAHVHGTVAIDRFSNSAVVDARIDTNTVSMRTRGYETWVKSPEFFDTQHYPEIRFVSESTPLQRLQTGGEIDGALTVRGVTRHVRFNLIAPTCPAAESENCPIEADGNIERSEFGMHSQRGALSNNVELRFSIYTAAPTSDPDR
ncbi:MAG TPA: YceI family protein [Rudaea sp.]|jgi:polyisoprenoid-binding protein YceI|uniref:YceI family protein n=1 Tax=Rudaea sp. TaxID=2136325 RepID=UPI002F94738D